MKRNRKGFTLIELLIVVVIVGILALAAIPLITSNARDARRAEGEQMMGSMRGQARVAFAKLGAAPATLNPASNVKAEELAGKYFNITNTIASAGSGATATGTITAVSKGSDGTGAITFTWSGGDGTFSWSS